MSINPSVPVVDALRAVTVGDVASIVGSVVLAMFLVTVLGTALIFWLDRRWRKKHPSKPWPGLKDRL